MNLFPIQRLKDPISPEPPLRDETKFPNGKIAVFQYVVVAVFLFLISGFWDLQVSNPEMYNEKAERNRIKSIPVLAPRGKILDRDGRVIVDNRESYSLILSRENLKPEHVRYIAQGLNIPYPELEERLRRFRSRPAYEPIIIKEELSPGELAFVEANRDSETFPEMELIPAQRRMYPTGGIAAHVIGYVGEVSETELNTLEYAKYDQGDVIGKFGIERQYNEILMGVDGQRQVMVDNRGRHRAVLGIKEAVAGRNLRLTIDLDLQVVAELGMESRKGAVVALDPRNGEVLAMVSKPGFDPNKFAGRIRSEDWKEIVENPDNPMLNRAIQAQFAPGSTFKPVVLLAGLETGEVDDSFGVRCPGGASFYGRYFRCHEKRGHGGVDLHKGMVVSCDVFFYNVGNRVGIDKLAEYSRMCGFGEKSGIDLPHEKEGLVPSQEWKMRAFRQRWYAGETISVSIGQGALTVTPLQLARAIGGIAAGGVWHRPHLVEERRDPERARRGDIDIENVNKIVYGMWGVVNEGGGTGGRARLVGYDVCGKTGTAQIASLEAAKGRAHLKDNAWFVAFAPREAPEIVVVALFEGGEHGYIAAPVARDIIKAYFDKKIRNQQPPPMLARPPALLPRPVPAAAAKPVLSEAVIQEASAPAVPAGSERNP